MKPSKKCPFIWIYFTISLVTEARSVHSYRYILPLVWWRKYYTFIWGGWGGFFLSWLSGLWLKLSLSSCLYTLPHFVLDLSSMSLFFVLIVLLSSRSSCMFFYILIFTNVIYLFVCCSDKSHIRVGEILSILHHYNFLRILLLTVRIWDCISFDPFNKPEFIVVIL